MKFTLFECSSLDVKPRRNPLTFTEWERSAADYIADHIRGKKLGVPIGKFIYHVCAAYGADHHRVACHLGMRVKHR